MHKYFVHSIFNFKKLKCFVDKKCIKNLKVYLLNYECPALTEKQIQLLFIAKKLHQDIPKIQTEQYSHNAC